MARARPADPGEIDFEALVADRSVDAAIVCTPNTRHAAQASALLEAGVHVAVEFPLAESAAEARALFELARERKRVLWVEHIELLSPTQHAQRERVKSLGRPTGGALRFSGDSGGWIGDEALAGTPALRALARLHRLVDLFGEASVRAAALERRGAGYRLEVELGFAAGGNAALVEERGPDLARFTRWEIRCERGLLEDPEPTPARGLFADDLERFLDAIEHGAAPYVSEERILHVLGLVEAIEAACRSG
jgi:biliverdin reductase